MSETSTLPSNREWFRRLLSGRPHQVIGGHDDPYLLRWYLIPRNPVLNVYLHKFLRSDDDRALHDHPWWFVSVILKGEYREITEHGDVLRVGGGWRLWEATRLLAFRPAEWRHRVALIRDDGVHESPCWTLIVTGRRTRTWGFWCRRLIDTWSAETPEELDLVVASTDGQVEVERFMPWDEFGDAGCGEASMSASTDPLVCTLAQLNGPGMLGFLVQCSVCPQQALVAAQPDGEWLCPRCAEVAERAPVRLPAEFDTPSGLAALLRHHGVRVEFDDDEYPLGKVRG